MEDKEKKQMLTTELTKEKSGGSAGMIQDMSINGIKLHLAQNGTGGPVIFWGMYPHQPNEVEHLWESFTGTCAGTKISCSSHFRWKTGIGIFRLGKQRRYSERKLRRTKSEDAEMADRGMCATY